MTTRLVLAVLVLALASCRSTAETAADAEPTPADFGHRFDDADPDGRQTMLLAPPDPSGDYFTYPAVVTDVTIRTGPTEPDGRRPVEVLLAGALPDACTFLHEIEEERMGNIIDVTFEIRRPKGVMCAQVVRPFRFYYTLDGPLPRGPYTLRVNGSVHPFEVLPERP